MPTEMTTTTRNEVTKIAAEAGFREGNTTKKYITLIHLVSDKTIYVKREVGQKRNGNFDEIRVMVDPSHFFEINGIASAGISVATHGRNHSKDIKGAGMKEVPKVPNSTSHVGNGYNVSDFPHLRELFVLIDAKLRQLKKPNNQGDRMDPTGMQSSSVALPALAIAQAVTKKEQEEQEEVDHDTKFLTTSEIEAVVKVRYGQGAFRDALVKLRGAACWMSDIEGTQLLIASHIKPWSQCREDTEARGNTDNGLLLSSLWDAAFDARLISFDSEWKVICSAQLSDSAKRALAITEETALPEQFRNKARLEFLAHHRDRFFLQ